MRPDDRVNTFAFEEVLPNIVLVSHSWVAIVAAKGERLAIIDTGLA